MKNKWQLILLIIVVFIISAGAEAARPKKKATAIKRKQASKPAVKRELPIIKNAEEKPVPFTYPPAPQQEEKSGLAVGIKAGASAGLTGAVGDVVYSLDRFVSGAAVRGSVGYLTGSSNLAADQLKMATVNLDAIYSPAALNPSSSPFQFYIGGGLIYPLKVSRNRGAGAWGAHAYLGSKYSLMDNTSIYGEIAYTGIKYQADEAALRGAEVMMGYSYSF